MTAKLSKIFEIDGAHQSGVTCATLGPRSANILVTGGIDRELCLWRLDKKDPLITLSGHQSYIESVALSWDECQVAGGSVSGIIKIWDIAKNQILSTLTGHRGHTTALAHNPLEKFIWSSGSLDSTAKLWDVRCKNAVNTFKGHSKKLCFMDFSPDGRWLVTASDDCHIKVWDITNGKQLADLCGHSGPVTSVQFHPNEYLLASGSADKTVRFWDLETFECVGQSETDSQPIQNILFHPSGQCLFALSTASLRVIGWEPTRCYDTFSLLAHNLCKLAAASIVPGKERLVVAELAGRGINLTTYSADIKQFKPFSEPNNIETHVTPSNFEGRAGSSASSGSTVTTSNSSIGCHDNALITCQGSGAKLRRSFHDKSSMFESLEQSGPLLSQLVMSRDQVSSSSSSNETTPTDDDEEISRASQFTICSPTGTINVENYTAAFKPKHILRRSPSHTPVPADPEASTSSAICSAINTSNLKLQQPVLEFNEQKLPLEKLFISPKIGRKAIADVSSGSSISGAGKVPSGVPKAKAMVLPLRTKNSAPEIVNKKAVQQVIPSIRSNMSSDHLSSASTFDHLQNMDLNNSRQILNPSDFLPSREIAPFSPVTRHTVVTTEDECMQAVEKQSASMAAVLQNRVKSAAVVSTIWKSRGLKSAVDTALSMNNAAVVVDLLNIINLRSNMWSLDLCVMLLPQLKDLLESKYETYVHAAVNGLRLILREFGLIIKNGLNVVPSIGVDITQEERYNKCQKCYVELLSIRNMVMSRQQKLSNALSIHTHKEICLLMQQLDS